MEESKNFPFWKLEKIEDTFRQVANVLNSYDRGSCLSRDIMECWNWVYDIMNDIPSEETSKNGVMYRLRVGQRPGDNNTRYENGKKIKKNDNIEYIDLSNANDKTKSQLYALSALKKIEDWFNSLTEEEKADFAERYPTLVTTVLRKNPQ